MYRFGTNQFQEVHMKDSQIVEGLLTLNNLLYDRDNVDEKISAELVRRSVQKHGKSVQLLRYNNHISFVSDNNEVFQSLRCPDCDTFFNRTSNLERHITSSSKRVKHVYPENVYEMRETLFCHT